MTTQWVWQVALRSTAHTGNGYKREEVVIDIDEYLCVSCVSVWTSLALLLNHVSHSFK